MTFICFLPWWNSIAWSWALLSFNHSQLLETVYIDSYPTPAAFLPMHIACIYFLHPPSLSSSFLLLLLQVAINNLRSSLSIQSNISLLHTSGNDSHKGVWLWRLLIIMQYYMPWILWVVPGFYQLSTLDNLNSVSPIECILRGLTQAPHFLYSLLYLHLTDEAPHLLIGTLGGVNNGGSALAILENSVKENSIMPYV